jgi:hypothetical protein
MRSSDHSCRCLPRNPSEDERTQPLTPQNPAYVIYTSGSKSRKTKNSAGDVSTGLPRSDAKQDCLDEGLQRGSGRPIPPLVSKFQIATTKAGAKAQGGLTPDFLALSIDMDEITLRTRL